MPRLPSKEYPENLRPYIFHGIDLNYDENDKEAIGECPFCYREGKFSIEIETSQSRCFVCGESMNARTFLNKLHSKSIESSNPLSYEHLANERGLSYPETLIHWEVGISPLDQTWLVPGYSLENKVLKLSQLYRYITSAKRKLLLPTPGFGHKMFGLNLYDPNKLEVFLCEGPWDAMVLWETLRRVKVIEDGSFSSTANVDKSVLADANVLAVPGCGVFFEDWTNLFEDAIVHILYDSDKPKDNHGKIIPPAGLNGVKRVAKILSEAKRPPESINYLCWGEEGYDESLPSGYDIRDLLNQDGVDKRIGHLPELFNRLKEVPKEWLSSQAKKKAKVYGSVIECLKCETYKQVVTAWRKALKWTDGLDAALCVMLSSVMSTNQVGEQLWFKILGPPSCLDGDTIIYDPIDRTSKSIKERYKTGKRFHVWTMKSKNDLGIAEALPPERKGIAPIYEIELQSGKKIKVTGGHQIWNGVSYVDVEFVFEYLQKFDVYRLPSILESDLLTREKDVQHWSKTTQGFQENCYVYPYLYDEQLPQAKDNDLDVVPLQNDAQEHNPHLSYRDNHLQHEYKHNRPFGLFDHLSSFHVQNLLELLRNEVGSLSQLGSSIFLPFFCSFSEFLHTYQQKVLNYKDRLASLFFSYPKSFYRLFLSHSKSYTHETDLLLVSQQSDIELAHFHRVSDKSQSFLDKQLPLVISVKKVHNTVDLKILTYPDAIVKVTPIKNDFYYDFCVPETKNYWAENLFHHNSGKTTILEGLAINKKYVLSKDTIRGFYSGWKTSDGEDYSIAAMAKGKTLATKDGDTLLKAPNLKEILSEARGLYDGSGRTHYRNTVAHEYEGHRMTWLLCGTNALREIDDSELGARFLDCVVMDTIDEEFEDDVAWRVANQEANAMLIESNGEPANQNPETLTKAMQLTGGYLDYLRENVTRLLKVPPPDILRRCTRYAKFISIMRARPSKTSSNEADAEREFSARLTKQLVRLCGCLVVVMNRDLPDTDVMRIVRKVTLDTSRGQGLEIVKNLYKAEEGLALSTLSVYTGHTDYQTGKMLRFLHRLNVVKTIEIRERTARGTIRKLKRWDLTNSTRNLYRTVMIDA